MALLSMPVSVADQTLLAHQADSSQNQALLDLKEAVSEIIPATRTVELIKRNPQQARNELIQACLQVLDTRPWLAKTEEVRHRLIERYLDSVFGLGPLEKLLDDDSITEIMVNGTQAIYYEREGRLFALPYHFVHDDQVYALIDRIIAPLGRRIDESSPMVNARLSQGHRVNAIIPPLELDGPLLTIRKFRAKIYTLEELRSMGSLDDAVLQFLQWAVTSQLNIAVSGGTGSGKTTLLNALSVEIPVSERIITIEDNAELKFLRHPHVVRLESRPQNAEGVGQITIKDLVINALRMRPDRIVVGECRGAEALDMLQAMNTGHDGSLTTLHANSPKDAIARLITMVRYAVDLPVEVIEAHIAQAIDLVVQTTRDTKGRRYLSELVAYWYDDGAGRCATTTLYKRALYEQKGRWDGVPALMQTFVESGVVSQKEVERWTSQLS